MGQRTSRRPAGLRTSEPTWPGEVRAFCRRHALTSQLRHALALAREQFPNRLGLGLHLRQDPEDGQQWVEIKVDTPGPVREVLAARLAYLSRWVAAAPPDARPRVRLSCNIL
jgi:hypothetical protein